jgi:hypothetical protein
LRPPRRRYFGVAKQTALGQGWRAAEPRLKAKMLAPDG